MRVLIVGGGRVGYFTAKSLREHGIDVRVIEQNQAVCEKLANDLDILVINNDGTTVEGISEGGCKNVDVFVALTGRDEDNIVACQIAKNRFKVKKTIARAKNPRNVETMKMLGADIAVSSTQIITNLIETEIEVGDLRLLATLSGGDATIVELVIPPSWSKSGATVSELKLPEGCVLVSVVHEEQMQIPKGGTKLFSNDHITAIVKRGFNKALAKVFRD